MGQAETWHYVGDTDEPAFENSWANSSSFPKLAFRIREAGVVDIQGVTIGGATGTTVFTLPEGYRPSGASVYYSAYGGTTGVALIEVNSIGQVKATYGGSSARTFINLQAFLTPPENA